MSIKRVSFPAGGGTGEESGDGVAAQADLHGDLSIVCLHVCSAFCQLAAETESVSRVAAS